MHSQTGTALLSIPPPNVLAGLGLELQPPLQQLAKLAKNEIKQAYCNVPVHSGDRHLLGMAWNDEIYLEWSAPIIFTAVADGIQQIVIKKGIQHLFHYLDDCITVGPARSNSCEENLKTIMDTCSLLGVPLEDKTEGPLTCITLGMELDTLDLIVRLPLDKLSRLKLLSQKFSGWKSIQKCSL